VIQDESYDWRTLTLGIASLLAQMPEQSQQEGLLHVVARQLKVPVAALRAHAERLQLQVDDQLQDEAAREVAGHIVEQADIMAEWVAAILEVQRIRLGKIPLELRVVDLVELARACAADFQDAASNVKIHVVADGSTTWPVLADHSRLRRVLECLLGSMARQSATRSLELHIVADNWPDGRPRAILRLREAGRARHTDDLLEMLGCQTELDLELYVAREIIRQHGGDLWAEHHSPGGGSVALMILPLNLTRRSHVVLAHGTACSRARVIRACVE
jgi:signal transduction histidine kinase